MYSSSVLVLALAVFGASAQNLVCSGLNGLNGGLLGGVSGVNGGLLGGVSGIVGGSSNIGTAVASTPVLENAPLRLPSIIHPASVQESCNCIKTIVRPTLRKEVFTIPSVQRFFQTTSTPVVETVPFVSGSSVDVPNVAGVVSGVESGLIGSGFSGINSGVTSGSLVSGVNSGFGGLTGVVSGVNSGFGGLTGVVSGVNSGFGCSC